MRLTAGGTLSVGGFGNTTYRYGAQVDNVEEIDVFAGNGDIVTCSLIRIPSFSQWRSPAWGSAE